MKKLFSEFSTSSAADWKQQITKDLKGSDFSKLIWHNPNGFDVQPFYTPEDLTGQPSALFSHPDWEICAKIIVDNEKTANTEALKALNGGASGLIFVLEKKIHFATLLKDISVLHIELNFELKYEDEEFENGFNSYLQLQGISRDKI